MEHTLWERVLICTVLVSTSISYVRDGCWNPVQTIGAVTRLQASKENVNIPGLKVGLLKSKLQEKTEQSQQLQDQILKQREALSRASQTLKDTRKAAGKKWWSDIPSILFASL